MGQTNGIRVNQWALQVLVCIFLNSGQPDYLFPPPYKCLLLVGYGTWTVFPRLCLDALDTLPPTIAYLSSFVALHQRHAASASAYPTQMVTGRAATWAHLSEECEQKTFSVFKEFYSRRMCCSASVKEISAPMWVVTNGWKIWEHPELLPVSLSLMETDTETWLA